jgi:RNA polymerase sigma factor (sigma-70 family)
MSYKTELTSLEVLASSLPFRLDEAERVNEAFTSYMSSGQKQQKVLIDLWTYCFVRRYFLIKFLKESVFRSAELDQIVEKTYQKVERSRGGIESHDRYAQWVSVVCRNTYINFVTRRRPVTGLEQLLSDPPAELEKLDVEENAAGLHVAVLRAIESLPEFLQPAARMKFVENLSYEEISRIIGKRVPTVRSYIHKTCSRFRKDHSLQAWATQIFDNE